MPYYLIICQCLLMLADACQYLPMPADACCLETLMSDYPQASIQTHDIVMPRELNV